MPRVLFLDDDPMVLDGLRDIVYPKRRSWQSVFVAHPAEAVRALEAEIFDVVVLDLCLPDQHGSELLSVLRRRFPDVVRLVLSGSMDREMVLRSALVAHQFLSKPCDARTLTQVIERSLFLRSVLTDSALRAIVGGIDALPPLPSVYRELAQAIEEPDVRLDALARIVERDIAISAKLLQFANSGLFGLRQPVTSVKDAVAYLGLDVLRSLALSIGAFRALSRGSSIVPSTDELQRHALRVCEIVRSFPEGRAVPSEALVAAMLHDIGKLVLASKNPDRLRKALRRARREGVPLFQAEYDECGVSHAEVGGYLLGIWGLPAVIVEAVACHHDPGRLPHDRFELVDAIHIADLLANEERDRRQGAARAPRLEHLRRDSAPERLSEWKHLAREGTREIT